ncbi:aldo/keto reductase [Acinetobacter indicus]|uniref:aldo/keto reductase n=1 Tax=Acinetobacter indicus TaxID=756892 RepID=UPI0014445BD8|nr:aldo/keto reductase [Acinetobacter indicus]
MNSVVVLQARTNSSRLPAKVLLYIAGIPIVVLAAKRAGNSGRHVIVATSDQKTDDALAQVLAKFRIPCFRGDLDNTLSRIVLALENYSDDTRVFRLTADNVIPDGALLDEIEKDFVERNMDYLCCNGEQSGLPYGVSVELTKLKHLRDALVETNDPFDLEHVTPFIRRRFGENYFTKYRELSLGHYRCTVDCLDDYLVIQELFKNMDDPISASALVLATQLKTLSFYQPENEAIATKLVLGTAQLGLDYGIANKYGKPDKTTAEKIVKTAIVNGAKFIDTARAYGDSENILGAILSTGWSGRSNIITKLSPLIDESLVDISCNIECVVDSSVYHSCKALRTESLDVLLLHRATQMTILGGKIWSRLLFHKEQGLIKSLGVSVQSPEELENVLSIQDVEIIQLPYNVLDWRWDSLISKIIEEKNKRSLTIHIRSTLLQGLLTSQSQDKWRRAHVKNAEQIISWLNSNRELLCAKSIAEFCLRFVTSLKWVDGIVVGVETIEQLLENINVICLPEISSSQIDAILKSRPVLEHETLNPASWS